MTGVARRQCHGLKQVVRIAVHSGGAPEPCGGAPRRACAMGLGSTSSSRRAFHCTHLYIVVRAQDPAAGRRGAPARWGRAARPPRAGRRSPRPACSSRGCRPGPRRRPRAPRWRSSRTGSRPGTPAAGACTCPAAGASHHTAVSGDAGGATITARTSLSGVHLVFMSS